MEVGARGFESAGSRCPNAGFFKFKWNKLKKKNCDEHANELSEQANFVCWSFTNQ